MWCLNKMLLNNHSNPEEIKENFKKYLETNENESTMVQNSRDAAKAVLKGKFVAIQSYLKKQEKSHINNLTLYLKQLRNKPKVSRRKEIIKIRAEVNEIETNKAIEKIMKLKVGSLKRETGLIDL